MGDQLPGLGVQFSEVGNAVTFVTEKCYTLGAILGHASSLLSPIRPNSRVIPTQENLLLKLFFMFSEGGQSFTPLLKHILLIMFLTTTTTSLFHSLNIQVSHHLQIARLIEAGGVRTA